MLSLVRKIIGSDRDDKKIIKQYTKDLSSITTKIHEYEQKLKGTETKLQHTKTTVTYYYLSALLCGSAVVYLRKSPRHAISIAIAGLAVLILIRITLTHLFLLLSRSYEEKLNKLRSSHQEKMEELKERTNFYYTNSLIQRFSSGENGSDDLMLLMDDEVKKKHEQLENLRSELDQLRASEKEENPNDEAREKWFDKVFGLLSGSDETNSLQQSLSLIRCPECNESFGCYSVVGVAFEYICPKCSHKIMPIATEDSKLVSHFDDQYE